jgi:hypothetical protein
MNAPTAPPASSTPLAAPPATQPTVGVEARLAPPLPAPPADLRLLLAALWLLAVALTLVWLAAARLRRRPRVADGVRHVILEKLDREKAAAGCPCHRAEAVAAGATGGQRTCADGVHALLTEFAAAATGLPCPNLTTQELRACESRLPATSREAYARLLDTLVAVDLDRFAPPPSPPVGFCLVDAAAAAVRNWPEEPAAKPMPAGSKNLS